MSDVTVVSLVVLAVCMVLILWIGAKIMLFGKDKDTRLEDSVSKIVILSNELDRNLRKLSGLFQEVEELRSKLPKNHE